MNLGVHFQGPLDQRACFSSAPAHCSLVKLSWSILHKCTVNKFGSKIRKIQILISFLHSASSKVKFNHFYKDFHLAQISDPKTNLN